MTQVLQNNEQFFNNKNVLSKKRYLLKGLNVENAENLWNLDGVGIYSMTPILLSKWLFRHLKIGTNKKILETCAGVGGDTSVLVNLKNHVTTFETDSKRFDMFRNNMKLAGANYYEAYNTKCDLSLASNNDILYIDVPWGGENVLTDETIENLYLGDKELCDVMKTVINNHGGKNLMLIFKIPPNYSHEKLQDSAIKICENTSYNINIEFIIPPNASEINIPEKDRKMKIPNIRWFVLKLNSPN